MQHLRWDRHGRTYSHADDGQPNTYTLTTRTGEVNVDVDGDGQTFAPYVLSGAVLRFGEGECEFADGWQTIRRLGQVLVSRSRLYVQRDVGGTWTDVPHGTPTRNIANNYPVDGRCTAYLDFNQIQGYGAGARFQIGIEVGGSERQIYGFRFRSPVAGTFRLEWVLEIPEGADLAWIEQATSRTDPTPVRVGGRIGQVEIRWSREESPFRSATVESDGVGGRVLHLILGPYTVAAMEWLTVYPDSMGPISIAADGDDWAVWYNNGSAAWEWYAATASPNFKLYCGQGNDETEWVAGRFALSASLVGATVTAASVTMRGVYVDSPAPSLRIYATQSADAPQVGNAAGRPALSGGSTTLTATYATWDTTGFNTSGDQTSANFADVITELISDYSGLASGAYIAVWFGTYPDNNLGAGVYREVGWYASEHSTYDPMRLSITYTPGAGTTVYTGRLVGTDLPLVGASPSHRLVVS